ncbi:hypothetical protein BH11MYX4_BH11MYX4_49960 [soil metagenome]
MVAAGEPIPAWDTEWELIGRADPAHAAEVRKRGSVADAQRDREAAGCSAGCAACSACATCVVKEIKVQ